MSSCALYAHKSWRCVCGHASHVWNRECQNLLNRSCSSSTRHWSVHLSVLHNPSAAHLMDAFEGLQRWPIRRSDETLVAGYAPSRIWNSPMASTKKKTQNSRSGRSNRYRLHLTTLHCTSLKYPLQLRNFYLSAELFNPCCIVVVYQPPQKCQSSQICKHVGFLQRKSWVK